MVGHNTSLHGALARGPRTCLRSTQGAASCLLTHKHRPVHRATSCRRVAAPASLDAPMASAHQPLGPCAGGHKQRVETTDRSTPPNCSRLSVPSSCPTTPAGNNWLQCNRRSLLTQSMGATVAWLTTAAAADAAPTLSSIGPPSSNSLVDRLLQSLPIQLAGGGPGPVRFPRKALDLRFAVLLMRSSYDAVNLLDFIAMDQFEARFWKLRQSELEGYTQLYAPLRMRQGDLTDPLYFDFISFSQYATINKAMQSPAKVFTERFEDCAPGTPEDAACGTSTRAIQRPLQFSDDSQLPLYLFNTAGDLMYQGLRDGFRGEVFGGPPAAPPGAPLADLVAGVRALLGIMVDRGYAISAAVKQVPPGGRLGPQGGFTVQVQGPANLWALQALASRKALVANSYDAMIVAAWLRASGVDADCRLQLVDAGLEVDWRLL